MTVQAKQLGIIAGNRALPLIFAREARKMGVQKLIAAAFEGETDPQLEPLVDELHWLRVGQLSRLIEVFSSGGIRHCVMVGQIAPGNLFDLRPDLRAMKMLLKLKEKNAHSIFGAIADELAKDGIELIEGTPWLRSLMPDKGHYCGPKLSRDQMKDVELGFRIAHKIAELDVGQMVVIKKGTVLAVEGLEGTDECLKRGGLLGRKAGAVAVKVAKPNHDFRFDIPCIGPNTVQTCAEAGVAALVFEAGKALLLEENKVKQIAQQNKISLTCF